MGKSVEIGSGELVEGIDVVLQRAATIEGRVTDATGAPIVGATVRPVFTRYLPGLKLEGSPGSAPSTGPTGHYKIEGLAPGTYRVVASVEKTWPSDNVAGDVVGYQRMFFPDTDRAGSEAILLRAGEVRTGVDFRLPQRRAASASVASCARMGLPSPAPV